MTLDERRRSILVLNGIGLLISSVLSGWLYFFFLLGEIDLWPFINHFEGQVPGDRRGWNMAHLEGITNGLILLAVAAVAPYLDLGRRQLTCLFWCLLTFSWLFTLPAIANAWFDTRGLAMGGGPWGPSLANDIIFLCGWPAMVAVHIAMPLLALGAWRHYRTVRGD